MVKLFISVLLFIYPADAYSESFTFVTLKTSMGNIRLKLFNEKAPRNVENFVGLALGRKTFFSLKDGKRIRNTPFYKEMIFHKVHPELGIQTGCPLGDGKGFPGYTIKNEKNKLKFDKGFLVAMSKVENEADSVGSQFFITVKPMEYLNEKYTVMGEVIGGQEVVKKISRVKTDVMMRPLKPVKLLEVIVDET